MNPSSTTRLKMTAKLKIIGLVVMALAVALLLMVAHYLGGYALASLKVREWLEADAWHGQAIWLPDYQVVVEAQPLANLKNNLSGLAYDPDRNTVFSVTNPKPEIIEFSLKGTILRRITLSDFGDTEAIEYLSRDTYLIADERKQRLIKVRITDSTTELHADDFQQLTLGIDRNGNKGCEG